MYIYVHVRAILLCSFNAYRLDQFILSSNFITERVCSADDSAIYNRAKKGNIYSFLDNSFFLLSLYTCDGTGRKKSFIGFLSPILLFYNRTLSPALSLSLRGSAKICIYVRRLFSHNLHGTLLYGLLAMSGFLPRILCVIESRVCAG